MSIHITRSPMVPLTSYDFEFENLSVEKRRFRMHRNSSPGISIAGRLYVHSCKNIKYFENFFSSILLYSNDLSNLLHTE